MATELTAERLAEQCREWSREMERSATVVAPYSQEVAGGNRKLAQLLGSAADALLRADGERDKARADLHALRTALVEATMEPFDIGPCYIAGPLPLKQKHNGEAFAVQHERLLGVFQQLLDRVEAKASGTTEACNRVWRERDHLRAQRDALVAVLQSGQSLRTHDIDTTDRWVIDDVDEVREAIRAAKENQ